MTRFLLVGALAADIVRKEGNYPARQSDQTTPQSYAKPYRQPLECHDFGGSFLLIFLVSFHNFSYHFFYIFISFCVSGYTLSVLFRVKLV